MNKVPTIEDIKHRCFGARRYTVDDIIHNYRYAYGADITSILAIKLALDCGYVKDEINTNHYVKPDLIIQVVVAFAANGQGRQLKNTNRDLCHQCDECGFNFSNGSVLTRALSNVLSNDLGYYRLCNECVEQVSSDLSICNHCDAWERAAQCDRVRGCRSCKREYVQRNLYSSHRITKEVKNQDKGLRHVGCEIECYVDTKHKMELPIEWVVGVKHDGSLSSEDLGSPIELVTQPLYGSREKAIKHICKELSKNTAEVDSTCGGHVHVDAEDLKLAREPRRELVRDLFRIYEGAFYAITVPSRIRSTYCSPVDHRHTYDSRYRSLNFMSVDKYNTLEFRCFGGSVEPQKWLDRIELCQGFVNLAAGVMSGRKSQDKRLSEIFNLVQDSGFLKWDEISCTADFNHDRPTKLKAMIREHGEVLINLAGLRFGLKEDTIERLIQQHLLLWKKNVKKKKAA